jgi:hypothetical protein
MTQFFRDEYKTIAPGAPDFSGYVFFGSSTADLNWAISTKGPEHVIAYHHHMEDRFDVLDGSILDAFAQDQRWAREVAGE